MLRRTSALAGVGRHIGALNLAAGSSASSSCACGARAFQTSVAPARELSKRSRRTQEGEGSGRGSSWKRSPPSKFSRGGGRPSGPHAGGRRGGGGGGGAVNMAFSEQQLSQIWDAHEDLDTQAEATRSALEEEYRLADVDGFDHTRDFLLDSALPDGLALDELAAEPLRPGDFVELRRLNNITLAVVIHPPPDYDGKDARVFVLTRRGLIDGFKETDVMLRLPAMVPQSLVKEVRIESMDELSQAMNQAQQARHQPAQLRPEGVKACTAIVARLRAIEMARDDEIRRLLPAFQREYLVDSLKLRPSTLEHDDTTPPTFDALKDDKLSTWDVARRLNQIAPSPTQAPRLSMGRTLPARSGPSQAHTPGSRGAFTTVATAQASPSTLTLFAAHSMLMAHPEYFVADDQSQRSSYHFTKRDESDRQAWRQIQEWLALETRGSAVPKAPYDTSLPAKRGPARRQTQQGSAEGPIAAFCRRARLLRQRKRQSLPPDISSPFCQEGGPPTAAPMPGGPDGSGDIHWTAEDQVILKFIRTAVSTRRAIQNDLFKTLAMTIVKRAGGSPALPTSSYEAHADADSTAPDVWIQKLAKLRDNAAIVAKKLGLSSPSLLTADSDLPFALMHSFLIDVGVLAPWENTQMFDKTLQRIVDAAKKVPGTSQTITTSSSTSAVDQEVKRHDFGALPVYVVDDASAHELDDGVSIEPTSDPEEWWVHIHVADPASVIAPNSWLAKHAAVQGSTVYFPEARFPLLPLASITEDIDLGSLIRGGKTDRKSQKAITFSAKVHERTGKVSDYKVQLSMINNIKVRSYYDVQALFDGTGDAAASFDENDRNSLQTMRRLAVALAARRIANGMFLSSAPKAAVKVSPLPLPGGEDDPSRPLLYTGFPQVDLELEPPPKGAPGESASTLVSELMILAGRVMGAWAKEHGVPALYRGQLFDESTSPAAARIRDMLRTHAVKGTGIVDSGVFLRLSSYLPRTTMSADPMEHFAMGLTLSSPSAADGDVLSQAGYIRCTSPLRRFTDLLMHWQIHGALGNLAQGRSPRRRLASDRSTLLANVSTYLRQDSWHRRIQRNSVRHWVGIHIARLLDLQARGRWDEIREQDRKFLEPAMGRVAMDAVRATSALDSSVAMLSDGLGTLVDCEWHLNEAPPELGTEVMVKPVHVTFAGMRTQVTVRRV